MFILYLSISALLTYTCLLLHSAPGTETTMSQKALVLHEVGEPLLASSRSIPQPGRDQLLVKVLVAGRKFTNELTDEDERFMLSGF
jgi:hypothetical protein